MATITVSTHVMVTQSSQVTTTSPVSNSVDIKVTVPGKNRPKLVARLKGTLAQGETMLSKQITAKKLIGKGIVTFEITTGGAPVERYQATVVYGLERPSTSSSRR